MSANASIRIRIIGGIRAALETDSVADAMDRLGNQTTAVERASIRATAALKWMDRQLNRIGRDGWEAAVGLGVFVFSMQTAWFFALTLGSVALPALAIALWHVALAAGVVAAAFTAGFLGIFAAVGLMAVAVISRFKLMSSVTGSAANDLKVQAHYLKGAFSDATSAGSDRFLRGLADGLRSLVPLVTSLRSSFTKIGGAFGNMFRDIGRQLGQMGPQIRALFNRLPELIDAGGKALSGLLAMFIQLATVGAPLVTAALNWLARAMNKVTSSFNAKKLSAAQDTLRSFAHSVGEFFRAFAAPLKPIFGPAMAAMATAWHQAAVPLGHILGMLVAQMMIIGTKILPTVVKAIHDIEPALRAIINSGALTIIATTFTRVLGWIIGAISSLVTYAQKLGVLRPIIVGLVAAFVAWRVAMIAAWGLLVLIRAGIVAAKVAMWAYRAAIIAWTIVADAAALATSAFRLAMIALDVVMWANPIGLIVLAVLAVIAAFVLAYYKIAWFRNAVDAVWAWIQRAAVNTVHWITHAWDNMVNWFGSLPGRISAAAGHLWDGLKGDLAAVVQWIKTQFNDVVDWIKKLPSKVKKAALGLVHGKVGQSVGHSAGMGFSGGLLMPGMATGGYVASPGWSWVGERGPELLHVPQGATVYPHQQSREMASTNAHTPTTPPPPDGAPIWLELHSHLHQDGRETARVVDRVRLDNLARQS